MPRVGILYQNDDFGRDFLGPFKKVLADAGGTAQVIMEQTYDLTDPTVDSQLINLSKSGADVFYNIHRQGVVAVDPQGGRTRLEAAAIAVGGSTGRFDPQRRRLRERHRHRRHPLRQGSRRAALGEGSRRDGVRGAAQEVSADVDPDNTIAFAGYGQVASHGEILRRCGDDLTRANVLKQATTLAGFHSPYFLDGVNLQLHARRLHADEDALHLAASTAGLADFRQAGVTE
jgi:hypothetical protein